MVSRIQFVKKLWFVVLVLALVDFLIITISIDKGVDIMFSGFVFLLYGFLLLYVVILEVVGFYFEIDKLIFILRLPVYLFFLAWIFLHILGLLLSTFELLNAIRI